MESQIDLFTVPLKSNGTQDLKVADISISPLFRKLLAARGFQDLEQIHSFLFPNEAQFLDPFLMKGMPEAVERIEQAAREHEKVLIHGDYDVDGITGSALVSKTLSALDISHRTFLPDRIIDGYGVSKRAIEEGAREGAKLLITVDCGITAKDQIAFARESGIDVIVVDHHQIPAAGLPDANVILNPFQKECTYPFKGLSAGGLAFKLSQALIGSQAFQILDLAALSTVCDAAPLTDENRIIVRNGLQVLTQRANIGIKALSSVAKLSGAMNVGHIGFMLGPRINAAGRMSSPDIALQLLLTKQSQEAESLAKVLDEENRVRQKEERQVIKEAIQEVEKTVNFNRDRVMVVAREGWHPGVIGIVASRLVEKYYRPAVVIAVEKGKGKGSGRSIKNFPLHLGLQACHEHLEQYGGHAQAAGLSILEAKIPELRKCINQFAAHFGPELFSREILPDMEVKLCDLRLEFIRELQLLEPHGVENPKPIFFTSGVRIKKAAEKLYAQTWKMLVTDEEMNYEAILTDRYGDEDFAIWKSNERVDLFYTLKLKTWQGIETLSLEVKKIRPQL